MSRPSKIETVIRDWIFTRIRTADPAEPIPTIRCISRELDVSPTSVQKVVNQLKKEGVIDAFVGKGMFLRPRAFRERRKVVLVSVYDLDRGRRRLRYPSAPMLRFAKMMAEAGCPCEPLNILGMSDADIPGRIRQGGFSGIALLEVSDDHLLVELQKLMLPMVSLDYDASHLGIPSVVFDNGWGAFVITKHLVAQGHARISALTCETMERAGQNRFRDPVDELRLDGYRYAMMDAGLVPDIVSLSLNRELLKNKFFAIMARKDRPTALFIYHLFLAEIVVDMLRDGGYRIPTDISVVSVAAEDLEFEPGKTYTSVAFDNAEMGEEAAAALLRLMKDEPPGPRRHIVAARIAQGDSVHPLGAPPASPA